MRIFGSMWNERRRWIEECANGGYRYPDEVTVDDLGDESEGTGTNTPAGEPSDDFFTSWDKPSIKTPSNPPSRSSTPGIKRTASPFLTANQNGATSRPKSPLKVAEASEASSADGTTTTTTTSVAAVPTTARAVAASAVKKTTTTTKPKSNILGAKKTKLGAKKVDSSALDFDEAEKKAREEAERREKLGYDPDEITSPSENQFVAAQPVTKTSTIHQPTPLSPSKAGGFGSTAGQPRQRSDSEMERLGMGVRRLGFGQVGGGAPASSKAAAAAKPMGFGAVSKAPVVGKFFPLKSLTRRWMS